MRVLSLVIALLLLGLSAAEAKKVDIKVVDAAGKAVAGAQVAVISGRTYPKPGTVFPRTNKLGSLVIELPQASSAAYAYAVLRRICSGRGAAQVWSEHDHARSGWSALGKRRGQGRQASLGSETGAD